MADEVVSRSQKSKSANNKSTPKTHNLRKRQPEKPERGDTVIYVSTKSSTKGLLAKCNKLIADKGANELVIYCLGAAIQRGILLALAICDHNLSFKTHTNTLSTKLIDDLEPAVDDEDFGIQKRFNAALRIRVYRTDLLHTTAKEVV